MNTDKAPIAGQGNGGQNPEGNINMSSVQTMKRPRYEQNAHGAAIQAAREAAGLSRRQLAERIHAIGPRATRLLAGRRDAHDLRDRRWDLRCCHGGTCERILELEVSTIRRMERCSQFIADRDGVDSDALYLRVWTFLIHAAPAGSPIADVLARTAAELDRIAGEPAGAGTEVQPDTDWRAAAAPLVALVWNCADEAEFCGQALAFELEEAMRKGSKYLAGVAFSALRALGNELRLQVPGRQLLELGEMGATA